MSYPMLLSLLNVKVSILMIGGRSFKKLFKTTTLSSCSIHKVYAKEGIHLNFSLNLYRQSSFEVEALQDTVLFMASYIISSFIRLLSHSQNIQLYKLCHITVSSSNPVHNSSFNSFISSHLASFIASHRL